MAVLQLSFQKTILNLYLRVSGGSRGRVQGVRTLLPGNDLRFSNTTGILQIKTMWFIGFEVEQETSAPRPKKNPRSAPAWADNELAVDNVDFRS